MTKWRSPYGVHGVAEVVDHGSDGGVGEADRLQQRRGLPGEEPAVVGGQADGRVALVDDAEEVEEAVVVVAGRRREGVALRHPAGDIVAHPLAQAVVVVAGVVDRQQPPVLGVEHEEQAVEEDQGRLVDLRQAGVGTSLLRRVGEGLDERREDALEDHPRQILGDLLLVAAALGQGRLEEGLGGAFLGREGLPAEEQVEDPQVLFPAGREQVRQVGLEVAAGPGPGAVVVEAPDAAVGQHAPAQPTLRLDLGRGQVAEDLAVRGPGVESGLPVALVQGQAEALALLQGDRVPGAGAGVALRGGPLLGAGVREEQVVGDVLVAGGPLLRQVVGPSEQLQDRPDQVLLGDRLVGLGGTGEGFVALEDGFPEGGEGLRVSGGCLPLGGGPDAVGEEVVGEELAAHGGSLIRSTHVDDADRDLPRLLGGQGGLQVVSQLAVPRR